jgi:predicted metal-dependent hydrolase
MVHLKNKNCEPKDSRSLVKKAHDLCSDITVTIRDARISKKYIQFDISLDKNNLDKFVERLQPISELVVSRHIVDEKMDKEKYIQDGIFYFNEERFWEAHEAWEGAWKNCTGQEKLLLQGIILIAVAFAHYQKFKNSVCIGMMGRALSKIGDSSGTYHDIDVDLMKNKAEEIRATKKITVFKI